MSTKIMEDKQDCRILDGSNEDNRDSECVNIKQTVGEGHVECTIAEQVENSEKLDEDDMDMMQFGDFEVIDELMETDDSGEGIINANIQRNKKTHEEGELLDSESIMEKPVRQGSISRREIESINKTTESFSKSFRTIPIEKLLATQKNNRPEISRSKSEERHRRKLEKRGKSSEKSKRRRSNKSRKLVEKLPQVVFPRFTADISLDHLMATSKNYFPEEILQRRKENEVEWKPGMVCPVDECYLNQKTIMKASFMEEHWNMHHFSKCWTVMCRYCVYKTTRNRYMIEHMLSKHPRHVKSKKGEQLSFEDAYHWWCENPAFVDPNGLWIDFKKARKIRKEQVKIVWGRAFSNLLSPKGNLHGDISEQNGENDEREEDWLEDYNVGTDNMFPPEILQGYPGLEVDFEKGMHCPVRGCTKSYLRYHSPSSLETHWNLNHFSKSWLVVCRYCPRKAVTNNNMRHHLMASHGSICVTGNSDKAEINDCYQRWCLNPNYVNPRGIWVDFKKYHKPFDRDDAGSRIDWINAIPNKKAPLNVVFGVLSTQQNRSYSHLKEGYDNLYPEEVHRLNDKDEVHFRVGMVCPVKACQTVPEVRFKNVKQLVHHWNLCHFSKTWTMLCKYCGMKEIQGSRMANHLVKKHAGMAQTVVNGIQPKQADVTRWWCINTRFVDPQSLWIRISKDIRKPDKDSTFVWADAWAPNKQPPDVVGELKIIKEDEAKQGLNQTAKPPSEVSLSHLVVPANNNFPKEILKKRLPSDELEFRPGNYCPIKSCPHRSRKVFKRVARLEEHWNLMHYSRTWVLLCRHCNYRTYRNSFMFFHLKNQHSDVAKSKKASEFHDNDVRRWWCHNYNFRNPQGKWMNFLKARQLNQDPPGLRVPWEDAFTQDKILPNVTDAVTNSAAIAACIHVTPCQRHYNPPRLDSDPLCLIHTYPDLKVTKDNSEEIPPQSTINLQHSKGDIGQQNSGQTLTDPQQNPGPGFDPPTIKPGEDHGQVGSNPGCPSGRAGPSDGSIFPGGQHSLTFQLYSPQEERILRIAIGREPELQDILEREERFRNYYYQWKASVESWKKKQQEKGNSNLEKYEEQWQVQETQIMDNWENIQTLKRAAFTRSRIMDELQKHESLASANNTAHAEELATVRSVWGTKAANKAASQTLADTANTASRGQCHAQGPENHNITVPFPKTTPQPKIIQQGQTENVATFHDQRATGALYRAPRPAFHPEGTYNMPVPAMGLPPFPPPAGAIPGYPPMPLPPFSFPPPGLPFPGYHPLMGIPVNPLRLMPLGPGAMLPSQALPDFHTLAAFNEELLRLQGLMADLLHSQHSPLLPVNTSPQPQMEERQHNEILIDSRYCDVASRVDINERSQSMDQETADWSISGDMVDRVRETDRYHIDRDRDDRGRDDRDRDDRDRDRNDRTGGHITQDTHPLFNNTCLRLRNMGDQSCPSRDREVRGQLSRGRARHFRGGRFMENRSFHFRNRDYDKMSSRGRSKRLHSLESETERGCHEPRSQDSASSTRVVLDFGIAKEIAKQKERTRESEIPEAYSQKRNHSQYNNYRSDYPQERLPHHTDSFKNRLQCNNFTKSEGRQYSGRGGFHQQRKYQRKTGDSFGFQEPLDFSGDDVFFNSDNDVSSGPRGHYDWGNEFEMAGNHSDAQYREVEFTNANVSNRDAFDDNSDYYRDIEYDREPSFRAHECRRGPESSYKSSGHRNSTLNTVERRKNGPAQNSNYDYNRPMSQSQVYHHSRSSSSEYHPSRSRSLEYQPSRSRSPEYHQSRSRILRNGGYRSENQVRLGYSGYGPRSSDSY